MDEKRVDGGGLEKEKVMTTTSARFGPDRSTALDGRLIDPLRNPSSDRFVHLNSAHSTDC